MEYSDLEFDEEKYYLSALCSKGHDWNSTGKSLRFMSGRKCKECGYFQQYGRTKRLKKEYKEFVEVECEICGIAFQRYKGAIKDHVYCSKKCSTAGQRVLAGSDYFSCKHCGKYIMIAFWETETRKYCSKKCMREARAPSTECVICKNSFNYSELGFAHHRMTCSPKCYSVLRTQNAKTEEQVRRSNLFRSTREYYWKGVMDIVRSGKAPDVVAVKGMEIMDEFTEFKLELNVLYREKKWREYLMKVNQMIDEHGEHLSALLVGEVRQPQFLIRDINRAANTHLGVLREHRKEVVTNAFNHPDQIPTLIEL